MRRLRASGFTQDQAEAIASMPEERYVTREYFDAAIERLDGGIKATRDYVDARISQLETSLTWRFLGIAGLLVLLVGAIDKFVRP